MEKTSREPTLPRQSHNGAPLPPSLIDLMAALLRREPEHRIGNAQEVVWSLRQELEVDARRAHYAGPRGSAQKLLQLLPLRNWERRGYLVETLQEELEFELSQREELSVITVEAERDVLAGPEEGYTLEGWLDALVEPAQMRLRLLLWEVGRGKLRAIFTGEGDAAALVRWVCEELPSDITEATIPAYGSDLVGSLEEESTWTRSADVEELLEQAQRLVRERWHRGLDEPLALLERALVLAPGDIDVVSEAAVTYARQMLFLPHHSDALLRRATELNARSRSLAPRRQEHHFTSGMVAQIEDRWVEAIRHATAALRHHPHHVGSHIILGQILLEVGLVEAAIEHFTRAAASKPSGARPHWELARALALRGQWEDVEQLFDHAVQSATIDHFGELSRLRLQLWRQPTVGLSGPHLGAVLDLLAWGHPLRDLILQLQRLAQGPLEEQRVGLRRIVRAMEAGTIESGATQRHLLAELAFTANFPEVGMQALELAAGAGFRDVSWLEHFPLLATLRGTPRYEALLGDLHERTESVRRAYMLGLR